MTRDRLLQPTRGTERANRRPGGPDAPKRFRLHDARLSAVASAPLAFVAVVALASCVRRDDEPPPTYTTRDSAGVEIVESRVCAWGASAPWTVSETAELTIGEPGAQNVYDFARVADVLRYPDGRIAVADDGNGVVRIFGADGRHQRTVGKLGDGPGEFRSIRRILLGQERLWVFDPRRAQVSAFDDSGVLTETRPVQVGGAEAQSIGDVRLIRDGELFGIDGSTTVPGTAPSPLRDTAYVFRLGRTPRSVLAVSSSWTDQVVGGQSGLRTQPLTVPSWDVAGSNLYFSSGEHFEFAVADTAGRVRRIVRRLEPAPPTLPVYDDLLVDPSGDVWARRFGAEQTEWDLYDSRGSCRGTVRMPAGLTVHEIGEDYVLGVWRGGQDVAQVRLHRLVTQPDSAAAAAGS